MIKARVDTISKYRSDFQPIRPICFISECPAIPTTRVENSRGAIMVLIILRNISLKTWSFLAISGTSYPNSAPAIIQTRIHVVRDFFRKAYMTKRIIVNSLKIRIIVGLISSNELALRTNRINVMLIVERSRYGKTFQTLCIDYSRFVK
jgi:hypothetical protein